MIKPTFSINPNYLKIYHKVLLLENIHEKAVEQFKQFGLTNIVHFKKALPEKELIQQLKDTTILGIRSKTTLSAEILKQAKKLIAVGCFCIGTNQVDMKKAMAMGIGVFNAPYSNTRSVAELVLGAAIMLIRRIPEKNQAAHNGIWLKEAFQSYELRGKTLGIVGYGNIGIQLGILAEALGVKVIYYDVVTKLPIGNSRPVENLSQLFSNSDIVSLHVPEIPTTKNLVNRSLLKKSKKGQIIINYSRGEVINLLDLKEFVDKEIIGGVALDVFPLEPEKNGDPFSTPLQKYKNVLLTPHIGGSTEEAQENIGLDVSQKLAQYAIFGSSLGCLSLPEVQFPNNIGKQRLAHLHYNKRGVLFQINSILSKNKINILGQTLKTTESIGYVVLDLDNSLTPQILTQLSAVRNTISCRIIY